MIPKSLYKYQGFNLQSLRNLKNAQIFFNTPSSFNDPFDGAVFETAVKFTEKDYENIARKFIVEHEIPLNFDEIWQISDVRKKYAEQIESGLKKALREKQNEILFNRGCSCFSEKNDHILMWSHYGDHHKGFCLEFDTSFYPFQKARRIEYQDSFPSITSEALYEEDEKWESELLKPLFTKHTCWRYEEEWRIFNKEPRKAYGYKVNALKAVYFGSEAAHEDIEMVCLILQGQSKKIQFYKATKNPGRYSLDFEAFTYTPHIEISI